MRQGVVQPVLGEIREVAVFSLPHLKIRLHLSFF